MNAGDPNSPPDPDGTRADMGAYPYNYQGPITLHVPADYATIQAGIDDAMNSDTVLVAAGQYNENINFNGKNIAVVGDPAHPDSVVIDGGGNGSVVTMTNGEDYGAILDGLTITNGHSNDGGGIYCRSDQVRTRATIRNCIITNNDASGGAGGGLHSGDNAIVLHCLFTHNHAGFAGGGIYGDVLLDQCTFAYNVTEGFGGGLDARSSPIRNSIFWGNSPQQITTNTPSIAIEYLILPRKSGHGVKTIGLV